MPVRIRDKISDSIDITTVVGGTVYIGPYGGYGNDYLFEAWIDLSPLQSGDVLIVDLQLSSDDFNTVKSFGPVEYIGPVEDQMLHIASMLIPADIKVRIALTQTTGTARSLNVRPIIQTLEVL